MNISRGELLRRLTEASIGLAKKETLDQSDCFCFTVGRLTTFNDSVMVRMKSPLDFDAVVGASDLLGLLSKIDDDTIELVKTDVELRIKGRRKSAGIACTSEVKLPIDAVPDPAGWSRLAEGTMTTLRQAALICGNDETQFLATVVHVTPERVEACDNLRMIRVDRPTGFPAEVLIPAASVNALRELEITKVSVGTGWVYFKTTNGTMVAVRCSHEEYHKGLDDLLKMEDPERITLPNNLGEMIERAQVMNLTGFDALVGVRIEDGELHITTRKDTGWYKERKRVKYDGRPLAFAVNPKFMSDILSRTRDVAVEHRKMKLELDQTQFVVCLEVESVPKGADKSGEEEGTSTEESAEIGEDDIPF